MKINLDDIKYLVTESVKKILSEGISDITYHFTGLNGAISILKKNEFHLTMSTNWSDSYDKKRLFYLSTQRSRSKEIGYSHHFSSCVRIQLNGKLLSEKYSGKPIDYWGASMGKQSYYKPDLYGSGFNRSKQTHSNFEMEDRIFSYDPVISEASKYIERIDVYIDPQTEKVSNEKIADEYKEIIENEKDKAILIYTLSKRLSIPVFIYNNVNDFNFMTDNVINDEIYNKYTNYCDTISDKKMKYSDSELSKTSKYVRNQKTKTNILVLLFNVLTEGEIYRMDNPQAFISKTLKNFNLGKYIGSVISELTKTRWNSNPVESCRLLTGFSNAPLRKLNTEMEDDDTNDIMRFGSYILKKYGVSSFSELADKIRSL